MQPKNLVKEPGWACDVPSVCSEENKRETRGTDLQCRSPRVNFFLSFLHTKRNEWEVEIIKKSRFIGGHAKKIKTAHYDCWARKAGNAASFSRARSM